MAAWPPTTGPGSDARPRLPGARHLLPAGAATARPAGARPASVHRRRAGPVRRHTAPAGRPAPPPGRPARHDRFGVAAVAGELALAAYSTDVGFAPVRRLLQARETTAAESLRRRRLAGPAVTGSCARSCPAYSPRTSSPPPAGSSTWCGAARPRHRRRSGRRYGERSAAQLAARLPADTLRPVPRSRRWHRTCSVRRAAGACARRRGGHRSGDRGETTAQLEDSAAARARDLLPRGIRTTSRRTHPAARRCRRPDDRQLRRTHRDRPVDSSDGWSLISTSVLGPTGCDGGTPPDESELRPRLLLRCTGVPTDAWEHIDTTVVREALPAAPPPLGDLRKPVDLGEGLFVAGDHLDTPSTQGAMASGTRAWLAPSCGISAGPADLRADGRWPTGSGRPRRRSPLSVGPAPTVPKVPTDQIPVIDSHEAAAPPEWALLQRDLLAASERAALEFVDRYARPDGTLPWRESWPGMDGSGRPVRGVPGDADAVPARRAYRTPHPRPAPAWDVVTLAVDEVPNPL